MNTSQPTRYREAEHRFIEYAALGSLVVLFAFAALQSFGFDLAELFYDGAAHVIASLLSLR